MKCKRVMVMIIGLLIAGLTVGCLSGNSGIVETSSPAVEEVQSVIPIESEETISEVVEDSETIEQEELASEEIIEEPEQKQEESIEGETESIVAEPESQEAKPEYHWILNTNTMKVHTEKCSSVSDIKEKNKAESDLSPDELKAKGYTPCGKCKPFK